MKNLALKLFRNFGLKKSLSLFAVASTVLLTSPAQAVDVVYATSYVGASQNTSVFSDNVGVSTFGSTELTAAPGVPSRTRTWYGNTPTVSWAVTPQLNVAGAIYRIDCAHNSGTGSGTSCSTDVLVTLSTADGALSSSCTNTPVFQRSFGGPVWNTIGYITNNPGVAAPKIFFTQSGGTVDNTPNRLYIDAFRFTEINPCSGVAGDVSIAGPLAANQTFVTVTGVDPLATNISVYADGFLIGARSSGIVAGTNLVTTSALVANTEIKAVQIKNGCTGSLPGSGPLVGTGANPAVKAFLTFWKSATYAGPIGTNSAAPGSGVYYALKGSGLSGGSQTAPGGGEILSPNQCWQTVTFDHSVDDSVILASGVSAAPFDPFAALDGLTFAIGNPNVDGIPADSGPYDIYVDKIMNGDVVIEDFESFAVDTVGRFSAPNAQGSFPNPTSTYLPGVNSSLISSSNVFEGSKALRIRWQWNGTNSVRWARIQANATVGKNYPQIDTTLPITLRYLVLPVGETTNKLYFPTPPASQNKTTNETATFSVVAAGEGPFTYQWRYEGSDLTGETTSSYTKSNVQLTDAGTYSVLVTGAGGAGCSATVGAELTVTEFVPPPTIAFSLSGTNLTLNWSGSFNLQSKTNLNEANWNNVGVSTGPYVTPVTNAARFFRLSNP